jgi:hypothetical protein
MGSGRPSPGRPSTSPASDRAAAPGCCRLHSSEGVPSGDRPAGRIADRADPPASYHILKICSFGSTTRRRFWERPRCFIAVHFQRGLGFQDRIVLIFAGRWKTRASVLVSFRKSSTKSWRRRRWGCVPADGRDTAPASTRVARVDVVRRPRLGQYVCVVKTFARFSVRRFCGGDLRIFSGGVN